MTKNQVYSLDELNSKVYNTFILDNCEKPTLPGYFEAFFESTNVDWNGIHLLPRRTAINKYCIF